MAVSGDYAFVVAYSSVLEIIDIFTPAAASVVRTVAIDNPTGVAVWGGFAYVTDYTSGLKIVHISTPGSASVIKSMPSSTSLAVAALGGYAYVAAEENGLRIIDISIPAAATSIATAPADAALAVAVSGIYAYVTDNSGDGPSALRLIDVGSPASSFVLKSIPIPDGYGGLAVSGRYAYAAGGDVQVIDLQP